MNSWNVETNTCPWQHPPSCGAEVHFLITAVQPAPALGPTNGETSNKPGESFFLQHKGETKF